MINESFLKMINTHVVDILGHVKGRDQPIMILDKAVELLATVEIDLLNSDDVVFFDPFCKAGEILLASTFLRCIVKNQNKKLSKKDVLDEMYMNKNVFGLAPDERHYRLSLRTYFGNDLSHDEIINQTIQNGNYLSETDGRLDHNKFKTEFSKMINFIKETNPGKKIIAVGNPPYQESDGGAKASAQPIYNYFIDALIDSGEIAEFAVVIPARWFSGGKKPLENFRKRLIESGKVRSIKYFSRAEDVFPTVHVQGGVCFLNWNRDFDGKCEFEGNGFKKEIDLSQFDIIPDDPQSTSIINKIKSKWTGKFVSEVAWSGKPFGLRTFYFNRNQEADKNSANSIPCYTNKKKIKFVERVNVEKNEDKIDLWKVAIPNAYATGAKRCTLPVHQIFLIEKGSIATETYNIISTFKNKSDALRMIKYLQTDVCRYLLGLRKLTQHIPKDRWAWVPLLDVKNEWSEEDIISLFKFSKAEVEHIKKKVKEWS